MKDLFPELANCTRQFHNSPNIRAEVQAHLCKIPTQAEALSSPLGRAGIGLSEANAQLQMVATTDAVQETLYSAKPSDSR